MRIVLATDLDNTLIYSYKKINGKAVCVETKEGKKLSYMRADAYEALQKLNKTLRVVPITTRSIQQYQRINLLAEGVPAYAITSNGGHLLVNNQIDAAWHQKTLDLVEDSFAQLDLALKILEDDANVTLPATLVDGVFVYCKTQALAESVAKLEAGLDLSKVFIANNGSKLYVLPINLTKGMAVKRLKELLGAKKMLVAGDSIFDLSMLQEADLAMLIHDPLLVAGLQKQSNLKIFEGEPLDFAWFVLQEAGAYALAEG